MSLRGLIRQRLEAGHDADTIARELRCVLSTVTKLMNVCTPAEVEDAADQARSKAITSMTEQREAERRRRTAEAFACSVEAARERAENKRRRPHGWRGGRR